MNLILIFKFLIVTILLCYGTCEELLEGAECVSEEGMKGTCVDIHACMHVVKDIKEKNYPQVCSFQNLIKPIVCCTDCTLINDTRSVIVDRFGLHHFKTGRKAQDKCIEYVIDEQYPCQYWGGLQRYLDDDRDCYEYTSTRVIAAAAGGIDANRGQYPHMALLGYGENRDTAQWLCAGSLISHKYILTAAHCLKNHAVGEVRFIALGILKRTDPGHMWHHYNVKRAIPYPEYRASSKYHDIALLESNQWIKFNIHVLPSCLHTENTTEVTAFATGWGAKRHRESLADTLQTVVLTAYSELECSSFFQENQHMKNGYNHTTQMCYGDKDDVNDTCEGDSGGPLQIHSELSSCMHTIIGVVSFGKPCGFSGGSGMYTRVYPYIPWIESIVWR